MTQIFTSQTLTSWNIYPMQGVCDLEGIFPRVWVSQGYMSRGYMSKGGMCPGGMCLGGMCLGCFYLGIPVAFGLVWWYHEH